MADFNQCTFIGRLGADPEVKSFQNGGRVANLRIAVGERWKDKATGEQKERTEWVTLNVTSDGLIGVVERYLRKGSRIMVQGQLRTRKWQDKDGQDRYATEVVVGGFGGTLVMLGGKQDEPPAKQQEPQKSSGNWADELDDEIGPPF